jgi:hypothetical protein
MLGAFAIVRYQSSSLSAVSLFGYGRDNEQIRTSTVLVSVEVKLIAMRYVFTAGYKDRYPNDRENINLRPLRGYRANVTRLRGTTIAWRP